MLRRLFLTGLVPLLLAFHVWLAISATERVGLVYDEPAHIVAGLYHHIGDYRFQPENGTLPQRLEALPWLLAGVELPAASGPAWASADVWALGHELMQSAGQHASSLLWWSRLTTAMASLTVLIVLYLWSARTFGQVGGLISLGLASTCPNLLAHAGLATTDTWGALGLVMATLPVWRVCHRLNPSNVLAAGVACGLLALSKFNVVLMAPIAVGLVAFRLTHRASLPWKAGRHVGRLTRGPRMVAGLSLGALGAAAIATLVIWAGFGFRYAASPEGNGSFSLPWSQVLIETPLAVGPNRLGETEGSHSIMLQAGAMEKLITISRDHRLLPEAWLYGLAFVHYHSYARKAYFAGQYHERGVLLYFPTALLLKTTPAGLFMITAGLFVLAVYGRHRRGILYRSTPQVLLAAISLALAVSSNVNIGLRHILPVIAALWALSGAVALYNGPWRRLMLAAACMAIGAQTLISLGNKPHHLTYFNRLAGEQPDYWLVDSNLDWGQGLPELKIWLDERDDDMPVYLSYFGTDAPSRYGLTEVIRFADTSFNYGSYNLPADLRPGWYCFGATQFRRAYTRTRGPWTQKREDLYQKMLQEVVALGQQKEAGDLSEPSDTQTELLKAFDDLRLARLGFYLQNRLPDIRLPGGIMIYKLSEDDIQKAFYVSLSQLAAAVLQRESTHVVAASPNP